MDNRNGRGWRVYKLESPVPETETSPREAQNESRKCNSKHWMEQWVYRRAWLVQLTCILNIVLQIDDGETRAENVHSIPGHMERPLNAWWIVNIQFPTDFYLLSRSLCCLTRWAVGRETVFCLVWELSRFCRPFMTVRTFSIQTLGERMVLLSTSFFFIPCSLFVRSFASVTSLRSFSSQQQNFLRKPFSHIRGRSLGYFDFNARGDGSRLDRSICETMTYWMRGFLF